MESKQPVSSAVISHLTLRKTLGILGILLPIILVVGTIVCGEYEKIQDSISQYYYSNMGDIFVGILFTYALFLFAYKGYDWKDNLAGHLGCFFALGVALLPCNSDNEIISTLHVVSAVLLFSTLAYFSIFLFTKSKHEKPLPQKKKIRNRCYRACGFTIIGSIILMFVYSIFLKGKYDGLDNLKPIFSLETLALWSFGLSWIIKGEVLMRDNS